MPPLAAVPDVDRELDALYAKPLEDFTKARNDLATRLRKAHQADAAAAVRGLKKPTVVAWTANTLARSQPKLVAALVDAGRQLHDVQQRALAGRASSEDVAQAAARERDAIRSLLGAARDELGTRASSTTLERLSQTLRSAAVDPAASSLLLAGRLTEELDAVGFGSLEAVAPRRRTDTAAAQSALRARVTELRAEARRRAAEARDADKAAREAERAAGALREDADRKAADAERAAAELAAAEQELKKR
jgi:hypothetical protein